MKNNGIDDIISHVSDMCDRCIKQYSPCFTGFLSIDKQEAVKKEVSEHDGVFCAFFEGIDGAERKVAGIFPSDIYVLNDGNGESELEDMAEISVVRIKGSGYRDFSHRDVYGAIMSLGIKREAVGDIVFTEDKHTAFAAVTASVAESICMDLERVANDKVSTEIADKSAIPEKKQEFEDMSVTLASLRLDALLSGILNLSREKSKKLITSGNVCVNHNECIVCDTEIKEKTVISVRGFGKFLVDAQLGKTQKGRTRVVVRKYK